MFSQKFIFIFIFEYPLRIISELIKILVDTLIECYTDVHDVDEDLRTISNYGGLWHWERNAGVMSREVSFIESTHDKTDVAFRSPKVILNMRMVIMSTKTG